MNQFLIFSFQFLDLLFKKTCFERIKLQHNIRCKAAFTIMKKKKQVLCVVMKLYFLSKFKNTMSAKDRPGCPEGGMVQRSGTVTCLIVRDLSTSVVLPVVLNLYLRLLGRTARILYLQNVRQSSVIFTELTFLSFFGQLYNRIITWLLGVSFCFFSTKT